MAQEILTHLKGGNHLWGHRSRWDYDVPMEIKGNAGWAMCRIYIIQDTLHWGKLVNTLIKLRLLQKSEGIL